MISKMKKWTFLVYHKEYSDFLNQIRELGVVHIAERQSGRPEMPELQENMNLSARLTATLKLLEKIHPTAVSGEQSSSEERGLQVLEQVDALLNEKNKLQQELQGYAKNREMLQIWGDFDPANISRLSQAGYQIGFYSCAERNYNEEWEQTNHAIVINKVSSTVYFITITKPSEPIGVDMEPIKLPLYSLSKAKELCEETEQAMQQLEQKMEEFAAKDILSLKAALKVVHAKIEFSKVVLNTEQTAGDKLMMLQGWAPAVQTESVTSYLEQLGAYYEVSDPTPEDDVPVQLNNKGFFAWFDPICRLYMLPKYNELDLTPFFAPFFMLFFGLCLGDSGYGLFILLAVTGYRMFAKNIGDTMRPILSLVQVLATSTLFCGLLTGTFFGVSTYDLGWPVTDYLKSHFFLDNNAMFQLSLILGGVQIMFGMVLKAVNQAIQFGFKYSVATIGWIILLLSTAFAALLPSLLPLGGTVHLCILGVSAAMIFLYNSPGKNIFLNIGLGLWDSYNMATGLLGDVLSYVRLFALGLSGGILAGVFNSLAVGMSPDNVILGPIFMVLIFVIGHSINIFMNVLGAMVHPMRLTFVEFFKNSGYEGGGKEYQPFKK